MHDQLLFAISTAVIVVLSGFGAGFLSAMGWTPHNDVQRLRVMIVGFLAGLLVWARLSQYAPM